MDSIHLSARRRYRVKSQSIDDSLPLSRGVYSEEIVNSVYPVDPRYGFPTSDLAKIGMAGISEQEKIKIMQRLNPQGGTFMSDLQLSDDEMMEIAPNRYMMGDVVNIEAFRQHLSNNFVPYLKDEKVSEAVNQVVETSAVETPPADNNQ